MKRKSWLTGLLLIILLGVAIFIRVYYVNRLMAEVNISEDIYNAAKMNIGTSGITSAFAGGFCIQSLYISNLYLAFLIYGNFTVAGVYLNILYQVLTVLLVYTVIISVTNRYIAFVGSFLLAVFPMYIHALSEVTMQNMEFFLVALIGTIVISIIRFIYHGYKVKKDVSDKGVANKSDGRVDIETNSLMDTSLKEIIYDDIEDNKVHYIENPLPVPKRKEHKEMDYALEVTDSEDDYDVKDVTGKDFYDIE